MSRRPVSEQPSSPARRRPELWILAGILAVALGLRVYDLGAQSFWLDELLALQGAAGRTLEHEQFPWGAVIDDGGAQTRLAGAAPWWRAAVTPARDVHPPLYFVALRLWMGAAGEGEVNARFLSVAFSVLAVGLLYWAVREASGPAAGLWAAGLMAVAGPQVQYAQEARMYAMLLALGLGACVAVLRIERAGATWPRVAALAGLSLALVLTHYYAAGAPAALLAYGLIRLRGRDRRRAAGAIVLAGAAFVAAWGWIPLTRWGSMAHRGDFMADAAPGAVARTLERLAVWPVKQTVWASPPLGGAWLILLAAWVAVLVIAVRWRRDALLWCLWVGATVGLVAGMDLTRGTDQIGRVRYTLLAGPGLFALIGTIAGRRGIRREGEAPPEPLRSRAIPAARTEPRPPGLAQWRWTVPAGVLLAATLCLPWAYASTKPQWDVLGAYVAGQAKPGDVLVFVQADERRWYPGATYLAVRHYLPGDHARVLFLDGPASDAVSNELARAPSVWVFSSATGDPAKFLPRLAGAERVTSSEVVTVWHGRVR